MGFDTDQFYRGVGCRHCRNTGHAGRVGVHELLTIDDELRDQIVAGASIGQIRRAAGKHLINLTLDGFRKVREGITTIEEVINLVGDTSVSAEPSPAT